MRYLYVHGREVDAEAHRHVFFNDTATTEIYTLSLHDALPILASAILPERSLTIRSSTGVSWRHGPHHSAQKSTTTGMVRERSRTSCSNVASEVSKITSTRIEPHGRLQDRRPRGRGGGGGDPGRAPARPDRDAPVCGDGLEEPRARRSPRGLLRRPRPRAIGAGRRLRVP